MKSTALPASSLDLDPFTNVRTVGPTGRFIWRYFPEDLFSTMPNNASKSKSDRRTANYLLKATVVMQRLSYPTETVLSNKINMNRIVLSL